LPNTLVLRAPPGSTTVNPLTTILDGLIDSGLSPEDANDFLLKALGLPPGTDLTHLDPLAPGTPIEFQKAAAEIAITISVAIANGGSADAVLGNIVDLVASGAPVDLTDPSTLSDLFAGTGISAGDIQLLAAQTAAGNSAVDEATSLGDISSAQKDTAAETGGGNGNGNGGGKPTTLTVTQGSIDSVVSRADDLAAKGILHLDVLGANHSGEPLTITDAQAVALAKAGLDFVTDDVITVEEDTATASATLKQLEGLNVDSVKAKAAAGLSIDVGSGGLGGISADSLPTFTGAIGQPVDVTLNIGSGTLDPTLNLSTLVPALGTAGVDHVNITGDGHLSLSLDQAESFVGSGVDFVAGDDITLHVAAGSIATVVGTAEGLGAAHIDHIDVTGDVITIDDSQAASLISGGLDFVTGDDVTVAAEGTHLSTTLKGLQDLHVDSVKAKMVAGSVLSIDAGGGLDSLSPDGLPSFTIAQSDAALDVTLNIHDGSIGASTDLGALAPALGAAGIDHIGVSDSGHLTLSAEQALDFVHSGVDFDVSADITVSLTAAGIPTVIGHADDLAALHVDHLDASGAVLLDDTQAATLIGDGIDFVTGDDVTVAAHGTHLATSLGGLQALHVDAVIGDGTDQILKLAAGDLSLDSDLPHFAAGLDVTLDTDSASFFTGDLDALTDTANKLLAAGIDHIGITGSLDLTPDQIAAITGTGLDFVFDPAPAAAGPDFGSLISLLEGVPPVEPTVAGVIAVS
ncbi:MAG: hypothetical protein JF564_04045, partial [Sphingomonas sp.]|nr:hypothetical protein [Sphingomonas sp.]